MVEPEGKETPNVTAVMVGPLFSQGNHPITIRAVIMGKLYRDGEITDEDVGGWVDVTLPP